MLCFLFAFDVITNFLLLLLLLLLLLFKVRNFAKGSFQLRLYIDENNRTVWDYVLWATVAFYSVPDTNVNKMSLS